MKSVGMTIMAGALLAGACARGDLSELGRTGELHEEYTDRKEEIDDCMSLFGDCLEVTEDNAAISDCAEALQVCLASAPEEGEDDQNPFPDDEDEATGESGDEPTDPEQGESGDPDAPDGQDDPQGDQAEQDAVGEVCDPILQACLDDPSEFDPFCLDDFEECVQVEVALELQSLCEGVQAQCLELDIPNFDCFDLCT
jgi:hypothetical protein